MRLYTSIIATLIFISTLASASDIKTKNIASMHLIKADKLVQIGNYELALNELNKLDNLANTASLPDQLLTAGKIIELDIYKKQFDLAKLESSLENILNYELTPEHLASVMHYNTIMPDLVAAKKAINLIDVSIDEETYRNIEAAAYFPKSSQFPGRFFAIKKNNKVGFINDKGKIVVAPQFDKAIIHDTNKIKVEVDQLEGLLSLDGDVIIEPKYSAISDFREERAFVRLGEIVYPGVSTDILTYKVVKQLR